MEITTFQFKPKEYTWPNALLLFVFSILFQPLFCNGTSLIRETTGIDFPKTEMSQFVYTEGDDLQYIIDKAPKHSTIICNRNRQLTIEVPIIINKPLTLKGLNARLPEYLGKPSILVVKLKGATITDFELPGNAANVRQNERGAGIILEKTKPEITFKNYIVSNNISAIKDNIYGQNRLVYNNLQ